MPGFDPAAFRAEQRRGEPRSQAPDDLASTLAGIRERSEVASKIEVSWKAQIQRARASANDVPVLLAAVEAVLKLGDRSGEATDPTLPGHVDVYMIREAITRELTGPQPVKDGSDG
jgi:hypothetical protein